MTQAAKAVIADPKAIASRLNGGRIVQKVVTRDEKNAGQWRREHNLDPIRKMRQPA